ncbi:D-alanyl-D-alanine carboxypeptidase family protein [Candidatus Uhrbacteria bacterium]|nr:D-alanyl-D-alanine carboxypeptidase family protein [Candidatus Uhrbacteria bacterium]
MRIIPRIILTIMLAIVAVLPTAIVVHAGEQGFTFEPVKPRLQIDVPTLKFSDVIVEKIGGEVSTVSIPWIGDYIAALYRWAVPVGAVLATIVIMVAGVVWLTSGGAGSLSTAKDWITNAVLGLLLLVGSYVILNLVNPDLIRFAQLRITIVKPIILSAEELEDHGDNNTAGGAAAPGALCRTIESCRQLCQQLPSNWPTSVPGMLNPTLARTIPNIPGLQGNGNRASQAVVDGLQRAALAANARGLTIRVTSGYRPLQKQIQLVCKRMGNSAEESGIGRAVAWPGGSNHGAGNAVDIQLWRGGDRLVGSGNCTDQASGQLATTEDSRLFDEIMTSAGAHRYKNEIWHYEFGGVASCRCTYPNCPAPPIPCSGQC